MKNCKHGPNGWREFACPLCYKELGEYYHKLIWLIEREIEYCESYGHVYTKKRLEKILLSLNKFVTEKKGK